MDQWLFNWWWLIAILSFLLGVQLMRWWQKRIASSNQRVNQEYFKGLNFLLNEQPDKAIEVFIKALEVDSETVELHLALGGLFRRKGQVDRATRIHQNLIARPSLTDDQRLQAIYELAQDYYKAGLLDRAENLFLELRDSIGYRPAAIEGLCSIYQQEKEWAQAIEVCKQHKRSERVNLAKRIGHFWCELADLAIQSQDYDEARRCIKSALAEDRQAARPVLLRGELFFKKKDYKKALGLWESLSASSPNLANLVVKKIICCYEALGDQKGLSNFLQSIATIPREQQSFDYWVSALHRTLGSDQAQEQMFKQILEEGVNGSVAEYLVSNSENEAVTPKRQKQLLGNVLERAMNQRIQYTCSSCGFDTKAFYWHCPNCGEWDSFS